MVRSNQLVFPKTGLERSDEIGNNLMNHHPGTSGLAKIVSLLILLVWGGFVFSHPGHAGHEANNSGSRAFRIWKDSEGIFELEAGFVLARDGKVQLRKTDGSLVWIPLEMLSDGDQEWVKSKSDSIHLVNQNLSMNGYSNGGMAGNGVMVLVLGIFGLVGLSQLGRMLLKGKVTRVISLVGGVLFVACLGWMATEIFGSRPFPTQEWIDWESEEMVQGGQVPLVQKHFEPFKNKLQLKSTADFLYVGSDGFPDHPMMIGIKAWQQQVPLPQPYTKTNAWRIPLHPKLAEKPISSKKALYSGAIALAVNGVPIFNALNNRGEDAYLAGELDDYGGHCGRGDDYHYHAAPVHLEKVVGKGNPIAYALDGFPIYGYTDSKGKEPQDLDEFNGRMEEDGYRYYSTKTYPYINGGMRGEVFVRGDRIEPQPSDRPIRPAGTPLRGATITDFVRNDPAKTYTVKYQLRRAENSVKYTINQDGSYTFTYRDASGKETSENYRRNERQEDKGKTSKKKDGKGRDGKKKGEGKDDKKGSDPKGNGKGESPGIGNTNRPKNNPDDFVLSSPAFGAGEFYPVEFTGDGEGVSPPLSWKGAPKGTRSFALTLWHLPGPGGPEKSYWVLYNIPAAAHCLPKNVRGIGKTGYNDKNQTNYDPMKSKGPGAKEYHVTLYALSAEPRFTQEKVTRSELLNAIRDITIGETTLSYTYERQIK